MNIEPKKINYKYLELLFNEISGANETLINFINEIDYMEKQKFISMGTTNFVSFMKIYVRDRLRYDYSKDLENMTRTLTELHSNEKSTSIVLPILYSKSVL